MSNPFTRTGQYFMAYDENGNEQVISFKHKASDSTFDDGMSLQEKIGTIHSIIFVDKENIPSEIYPNQIVLVYEDV